MNNTEQCTKLRSLQTHLSEELRVLKEDLREIEREGVGNPTSMVSIMKSLQEALGKVEQELLKCTPDEK